MNEPDARKIAQLEETSREHDSAIAELQTVLMGPGPTRSNGVRGELAELKREYRAWKEACLEEGNQVEVAKIQAGATKAGATWQATAAMITSLLTLVGVIIVALK